MFVDTSAVVALIAGEPDAPELASDLAVAGNRFSSPVVRLESSVVLASKLDISPLQAQELFDEFLQEAGVAIAPITDEIGAAAVECFEKYGKGRHPARLNIADCLSYACARTLGVPLLFKGDDFTRTDAVRLRR